MELASSLVFKANILLINGGTKFVRESIEFMSFDLPKLRFFFQFVFFFCFLSLEYNMWVTKTPEELIWGYEEPLFELAQALPNPPTFSKFGFFTDVSSRPPAVPLFPLFYFWLRGIPLFFLYFPLFCDSEWLFPSIFKRNEKKC